MPAARPVARLMPLFALLLILAQALAGCGGSSATPAVSTATPYPTRPAAAPFTYLRLAPPPGDARVYERVELAVETDGTAANPFDPAQVDLKVTFTGPSGETITVPAFFYQEFDPQTLAAIGAPGWRARFAPTLPGAWQAQAVLSQGQVKSEPVSFTVTENPTARGYVRLNQANPRYFQYETGDFYFPVGVNMSWSVGDVLADYRRWLDRFSANGGSLIRIWMASWSFGLEGPESPLGDYTNRLSRAWLLDQVFQMAEERGVTIMLCLYNHGAFSKTTNSEWDLNPYNAALGGPLQSPEDFVSDPIARDLTRHKVRYIAARWSYSTSLFAWEWWNEIHWTPITTEMLRPWLAEMTTYLRELDPYDHLVTHSTGEKDRIWDAPELQIVQLHDYSGHFLPRTLLDPIKFYREIAPQKPALVGEFGANSGGEDAFTATRPVHLHTGLWAAPFNGFAGTGMYWWWDNYIDPNNLWDQFRPVAGFFQGEDLAPMTALRARVSNEKVTALALQSADRALLYVVNNKYNLNDMQMAYFLAGSDQKAGAAWQYQPQPVADVSVTLRGMTDGSYVAYLFDTASGNWTGEVKVTAKDGTLVIPAGAVTTDLAIKVLGEGQPRPADLPPAAEPAEAAPPAASDPNLLDGFEDAAPRWKAGLPPGYNDSTALSLAVTTEHATQGNQALALQYGPPVDGKPNAIFYLETPFNLAGAGALSLDLFNDGSAGGIALALSTGSEWTWQETVVLPLTAGQQTVTFDLKAKTWKSQATGWENKAALVEPGQVQRIAILIFPTSAGTVSVDRFEKQ